MLSRKSPYVSFNKPMHSRQQTDPNFNQLLHTD